jgi:hypothetical protein
MEPLFCIRQLIENYKKKLCMVFIDLETVYNNVKNY